MAVNVFVNGNLGNIWITKQLLFFKRKNKFDKKKITSTGDTESLEVCGK